MRAPLEEEDPLDPELSGLIVRTVFGTTVLANLSVSGLSSGAGGGGGVRTLGAAGRKRALNLSTSFTEMSRSGIVMFNDPPL